MGAKVFVTQDEDRLDLSGLDQFGKKITIFTRSTYPDEADKRIQFMVNRAKSVFNRYEYNPDIDYVALVGDPLGIAVSFMIMGARGLDTVRCLKYDRQERAYYEIVIELKKKG